VARHMEGASIEASRIDDTTALGHPHLTAAHEVPISLGLRYVRFRSGSVDLRYAGSCHLMVIEMGSLPGGRSYERNAGLPVYGASAAGCHRPSS
jgi:hypothetical protein